jgi:hypothetical protein
MSTTTTARILTAKFPGTCPACKGRIVRGTEIRHEGRGLAYHTHCESTGAAPLPPRYSARTRVNTFRFGGSDNTTYTRNSRGRCEDAPCCGCCTI